MAAAAIVLALVAGIGVYLYASGADKRAEENAGFVNALVADSDIAKGTTGEEALQAGLVKEERVAKGSIPPSIVTDPNQLAGRVAASRIDSKQFITAETFVSSDDGSGGAFSNAINKQNLVAITVSVDAEHGVANEIAPGDHVNIATTADNGNGGQLTTYLLQDVKVLAVGASTATQSTPATATDSSGGPPTGSGLLTFEVSPDDALRIIAANQGTSRIYLVLLPPGSASTPTPTSGTGSTKTAAASK
jgi:pilus assembly protein CpaB